MTAASQLSAPPSKLPQQLWPLPSDHEAQLAVFRQQLRDAALGKAGELREELNLIFHVLPRGRVKEGNVVEDAALLAAGERSAQGWQH